jgi:hypothetical protein
MNILKTLVIGLLITFSSLMPQWDNDFQLTKALDNLASFEYMEFLFLIGSAGRPLGIDFSEREAITFKNNLKNRRFFLDCGRIDPIVKKFIIENITLAVCEDGRIVTGIPLEFYSSFTE